MTEFCEHKDWALQHRELLSIRVLPMQSEPLFHLGSGCGPAGQTLL